MLFRSADLNKRTEIDLSHLASEEVANARLLAHDKEQTVTLDAPASVRLKADETDARLMITNLLHNAIRYSGPGDHVDLHIGIEMDSEGRQWAVLSVSDEGPGIPEQDQAHIFERFYRVDKDRSRLTGGAGLGLSIVRQAAARYGGTVEVHSIPGAGATFTVRLPLE